MQINDIEESFVKRFRLTRGPTILAQRDAVSPIAFSRLNSEDALGGPTTRMPPEQAYTFQVALAPMLSGEIWIDDKYGRLPCVSPGDTFVFDLSARPIANLHKPYDFLRFYLPVATLDQLAYERGMRRVGGIRSMSVAVQNPVMHGLALSILPKLLDPGSATALFVDSIALAFHAHVMHAHGCALGSGSSAREGLTPRQLRRACDFIDAHLDGDPSIMDLARECGLSPSHFIRAFRQATGIPPHRWLVKRRIERAKELLARGDLALAEIAQSCGFVDQSHLTRTFVRSEDITPGRWRRIRWH